MEKRETFEKTVLKLALPVTAQSLLQSSFSVVDQMMIGQLGSGSIAGIGLAGKFASLYSVVLAAAASAAGIMISQYMGKKDDSRTAGSFYSALALAVGLAAVFTAICTLFPERVMSLYTGDGATLTLAAAYLRIYAVSFLPAAVNAVVTTMLRCMEAAMLPLYASMFALVLNTGLNYVLIFGNRIIPGMGVQGGGRRECRRTDDCLRGGDGLFSRAQTQVGNQTEKRHAERGGHGTGGARETAADFAAGIRRAVSENPCPAFDV